MIVLLGSKNTYSNHILTVVFFQTIIFVNESYLLQINAKVGFVVFIYYNFD